MEVDLSRFDVTTPGCVPTVTCRVCGMERKEPWRPPEVLEAWAREHECDPKLLARPNG